MRALLDTHVLLWALAAPAELSDRARLLLLDVQTQPIVSSASVWELGIKFHAGKLPQAARILSRLDFSLARMGAEEMPIRHAHALKASELPPVHRDPFDRMLIAQAIVEGIPIITGDDIFHNYPVVTVW